MLIGSKQAGEILGLTPAYIRQLCADEKIIEELDAQKIGKSWVFSKEKIEEFAERREEKKRNREIKNNLN